MNNYTLEGLGFEKEESGKHESYLEFWVRDGETEYDEMLTFDSKKKSYRYSGYCWERSESAALDISTPLHLAIQERMVELGWEEK